MALEVEWKGHTLEVSGNWTWRWLYLAPTYELRINGEFVDRTSGPRVRPRLQAIVEDNDGEVYHVDAELLSLIGYNPTCEVNIDGEVVHSGRVRVENFLNPFLVLFILISTGVMLYLGPEVIRQYWPPM
ncbi:thioredoxin family protein [Persicimonas caeni]|uniref:Thioredoxin family protein n=1 Tax=Persicimonas caeni TaxID=2292766 RepID=A0A4Y6PX61_PERCE|nr:thioredoxin family protein [Persicimonas caeni]QDG52912.1 thioredoxin family protein [Persicimonas caeni]QED34134.1 thioredoxin family protein [Persicimonas caeni]